MPYVDDIMVCFKGKIEQLEDFDNFMNSIYSNLKFTRAVESDRSINFLDLIIIQKST